MLRFFAVIFGLLAIFMPNVAFASRYLISRMGEACGVNCGVNYLALESATPINFVAIGFLVILGLIVLFKMITLKKYEVFSLKCRICGRETQGLKCIFCKSIR